MLTYSLDQRGNDSLYGYLYACIRRDIEIGTIPAHEKLPSKRALAKHLGVSLITIEGAYTQLAAEGYIYALERKGYFASPLNEGITRRDAREQLGRKQTLAHTPTPAPAAIPSTRKPLIADFTGGSPASGLFPYSAWAKTVREALSEESEQTLLGESAANGSRRLRETLAVYLRGYRGMSVEPEQLVIGAGAQTLYNLIVQLLGRQNRFAVEDPGYPRLTSIYRSNDVSLAHVPMDDGGISVQTLRESNADIAHITPSHQFPTGLVTSISRRYELLAWASEKPGRYIVEDDYDCEFRLAGRPIPALQTIDASERVIYTNTFTKSLGPAFRIGYMVLPPHLATLFEEKLGFYSCTVSAIDQLALARFIEHGDYERHVNRLRSHYRTIRNELIAALRAALPAAHPTIEAEDSGLHFILGIEAPADAETLAAAALARGVALAPLSGFYQLNANRPTQLDKKTHLRRFVMSYSSLSNNSIETAAHIIAQTVKTAQ